MRPVNLIPSEDRAGSRQPMRGGPLAYIIVGALAAAVIGVAVLAVTNNQISDSKTEIAKLEGEKTAVEARAQALDSYTQFHNLREQRLATITSLADSRFDWQRVMRELSVILPGDVWLTNLTGTATPNVSLDGADGIALRGSIPGPALELKGCAVSQGTVAAFVQALKQIDGVTRIGVQSSTLGEDSGGKGGSATSGGSTCQTHAFIAEFQMVAAFDAAPVASEETGAEVPAPEETTATSETEGN